VPASELAPAPEPAPALEPGLLPELASPPTQPPMSFHLPADPFKVICRLCFKYSHNIRYRQCSNCYQGTNYYQW
jgi:hypothetical protein